MVVSLYCKLCKFGIELILFLVVDVDECLWNSYSCHIEAFCVNTKGSYNCSCNPGLSGDGKTKCDGKS